MSGSLIQMKGKASIIILSLVLASSLFAGIETSPRFYSLPVVEIEEILSRWLIDSGFDVSRSSPEGGRVRLRGLKGSESWEIILMPHSPLASEISVKFTRHDQPDRTRPEDLWAYLEGYLKGIPSERKNLNRDAPASVLSQMESVVCIRARVENEPIQFSGFIVDKKGSIISTAHDLKGIQEMTVILNNGQEFKGRLVKMDPYRDLILIHIDSKFNSSISLAKGRTLLGVGEKVYSVGCPVNHQERIRSGIVDGPPRRVKNLPLWQVDMETLPGSSGSPVFDIKGNLVGVVKGRYRGTDSVGFLIPLVTVIEFLREK